MRSVLVSGLAAALLVTALAGGAMAQDEDLRMGDDPAYFERTDVPEAGVAISFPADWSVETMLESGEFEFPTESGEVAAVTKWALLMAEDPAGDICAIETYEEVPLGLGEHTALLAERLADTDTTTVESEPVSLPAGEAVRLVLDDPGLPLFLEMYLVDAPEARLEFACFAATEPGHGLWREVAETIEPLGPGPEPEVTPATGDGVDLEGDDDQGTLELEWAQVRKSGDPIISVLLPPDWELQVSMKKRKSVLPEKYAGKRPVKFVKAFTAKSPTGEDFCQLRIHAQTPMSLKDQAAWEHATMEAQLPGLDVEEVARDLCGKRGRVIEIRDPVTGDGTNIYFLDVDQMRHELRCSGYIATSGQADTIAGSLTPLSSLLRFEAREAAMALAFSPEWLVEIEMIPGESDLPPEYGEGATSPVTKVLFADLFGQDGECHAYRFDDNPMSLDEHAAWLAERTAPGAEVEMREMPLPAGDAVKLTETDAGVVAITYLLDGAGARFLLMCASEVPVEDEWRTVALSLELLVGPPPGVPDDAVGWWLSDSFVSVVEVSKRAAMRAACDRAIWIEHPDRTFSERIDCRLSDVPVDPPARQGVAPARTFAYGGGACEWVSDYWLAEDGSNVWAESWSITVEPDGTVTGTSTYGPELLECADG